MHEITINLHMHTRYSDGTGTHRTLALSALETNVDILLVSDHNVLVQGVEGYFNNSRKRILLLTGEEVHDQNRIPQHDHMLVFGANAEVATMAHDAQTVINIVKGLKGLTFLAHPVESSMPAFGEADISWNNWNVTGFTGLEIWNGFSELKSISTGKLDVLGYGFFPEFIPHGPNVKTLQIWDELTTHGQRIVAIGGSDAHALSIPLGPFHKTIFPYAYHFSTINTHALIPKPLTGEITEDRKLVYSALSSGHCFIGNDLPASTSGFRFSAQNRDHYVIMGDEISISEATTLQCNLPGLGEIRLLRNGVCVFKSLSESMVYSANEPGIYRIEVLKKYLGKLRGWIFSNPIYLR